MTLRDSTGPFLPFLLRWFPALAWTTVIAWFSSATFAASETGGILQAVLSGLWPNLSAADLAFYHTLLRKGAHVIAYAVLSLCWHQGLAPGLKSWNFISAGQVLAICLFVASLDEFNQSLLPSRTGSPLDVAWDMSGAVGMQSLLGLGLRRFNQAVPTSDPA